MEEINERWNRKMYEEVITLKHWVDGSGWSHEEVFDINDVDEIPESLEVSDVWEADEIQEGGDTQIIVTYYADDDEDEEHPLKEFTFWESDLFKEEI